MKSITKIPLIAVLLVCIVSCQKREEKTFTVKIYNPVTDELYENIGVVLIERTNTSSGGYTTESSVFYEGFTDANGEVMITGEFHKEYAYQLLTGSPEGVTICEITAKHQGRNSGAALQLDNQNLHGSTAYVELVPCAGLKYEIQNANCLGPNDFFQLFFEGTQIGYLENQKNTVFVEGTGCYSYMPSSTQVPSGDWYFRQEITKNGMKEVIYDTITLVEGQDYVYTINY